MSATERDIRCTCQRVDLGICFAMSVDPDCPIHSRRFELLGQQTDEQMDAAYFATPGCTCRPGAAPGGDCPAHGADAFVDDFCPECGQDVPSGDRRCCLVCGCDCTCPDRWHPAGTRLCLVPYGDVCPRHH